MTTNHVSSDSDALLSFIQRAQGKYQPQLPAPRRRGRQPDYTARSFWLLAVVAVVLCVFSDRELHKLLTAPISGE